MTTRPYPKKTWKQCSAFGVWVAFLCLGVWLGEIDAIWATACAVLFLAAGYGPHEPR